jgi:hypothetical protein
MDILNFISWIRGRRQVTSVDPAKTLIPVGLKDNRRDDQYLAGAITVQDFANLIGEPSVTFTQGSLEPLVQATMTPVGGTITLSDGSVYDKYRIQGIAELNGTASSYALLIGIVVGSDPLLRVREDSVILAETTNVYDTVASAMARTVLVRDLLSGNLISTTSTFIADDNTISAPEDHWFTLVMTSGSQFEATVIIDFTIAVPQGSLIEFIN